MKCEKCGTKIKKNYKLCPNCGKEVIIKAKENKSNILKNKKYLFILVGFILILIGGVFFFNSSSSIKTIRNSVVKINVYDKSGEIIQTGSGFIAFDKNILITNAHVITGGYDADAVSESDERLYIKGVLYYSQDEDIAILKLNNQNSLKPLKIATNYEVGDKVIAIGSPLGIKNSVSDGMISNILKEENVIQHSAPISSGSSGGTLFNSKGRVIGMNTATITSGQNINLAIPIETIKNAYQNSKDNKPQKISKAQYAYWHEYIEGEPYKTTILNNTAGKNIMDIIDQKSNCERVYATEFADSGYVDTYFMSRIVDSGYASNWIRIYANSGFNYDDNDKYYESIIPQVVIIKMNDLSETTVQQVFDFLTQEALDVYNNLLSNPYDHMTLLSDGTWKQHKFSTKYINSYKNPTIDIYNDYIYMIVCSDKTITKKIEKEIKKLP